MKTIIANVRVRKADRSANTYYDVQLIDGDSKTIYNEILGLKTGVYGYGEHYKHTTGEMVKELLPKLAKRIEKKGLSLKLDHFRNLEALLEAKILRVIFVVNNF